MSADASRGTRLYSAATREAIVHQLQSYQSDRKYPYKAASLVEIQSPLQSALRVKSAVSGCSEEEGLRRKEEDFTL